MPKKQEEIENNDEMDLRERIYEVGFLLNSALNDEQVSKEFEDLRGIITGAKAGIISEESPKIRALAYPISKKMGKENKTYDRAYFGWIKFETTSDVVAGIEAAVKKQVNVIRYILINTVRENTMSVIKRAPAKTMPKQPFVPGEKVEEVKEEVEDKEKTKELDKTIEELVIE